MFGIDFSYGYSSYDRKDNYIFDLTGEQSNPDGDPQFNFSEDFRSNNPDVGDKGFSLPASMGPLRPFLVEQVLNHTVVTDIMKTCRAAADSSVIAVDGQYKLASAFYQTPHGRQNNGSPVDAGEQGGRIQGL